MIGLQVLFWTLLFLTAFGGLLVPALMGVCVWIERREHRVRLAGMSPGDWWIRQRRVAINLERIASFNPRRLRRSDLIGFWPFSAFAFVVLMPLAAWNSPWSDDMLFALHPIVCVGWWLNMRSRGIIHAEVYALSTWVMAYVAWSWSMLALGERWTGGIEGADGDFVSFFAERMGTTSDVVLTLWLLYSAWGIACVLAGLMLVRIGRHTFRPLLVVAVWIPFVWGVLSTNLFFGFLGFVVAVGVAGYGISREARRIQDDADIRASSAARETRSGLYWVMSNRLIFRTAAVIVGAVAISISVRESGISVPGAELVATWAAMLLAPSLAALLARFDSRPRNASAWAAWAWLATVTALTLYHMVGPSSTFVSLLTRSVELGQGLDVILSFHVTIPLQALAVWLVAVVLFPLAYRAGNLRSYGALLIGLLWFPIATFAASFHYGEHETYPLPTAVGYASMAVMGFALLVIMWRFFGPTSAEESLALVQSAKDGLDQSR